MLKRTLVATALLASFGASAASSSIVTLTDGTSAGTQTNFTALAAGIDYSVEGSESATEFAAPGIRVALGAQYQAGDTITFTYNADVNAVGTVAVYADADTADGSTNSTVASTLTLGFLSKTANAVTYRVTGVTGGTDTTGLTLVVRGITFTDESVEALSGKVTMSYSALTGTGVSIDQSATGNVITDLFELKDELKYTVATKADGVIDVASQRLKLINGTTSVTSDTIALTFVDGALSNSTTPTKAVHTLSGDFSWIVDQATTTGITSNVVKALATSTTTAATNTTVTSITANSIVFTSTTPESFDITFETSTNTATGATANATALPATEFSLSTVLSYTDAASAARTETTSDVAAGSWTLNGATAKVRAYPLSDNIENFLWVTNDGSLSGAISVTAIADGETYDLGNVGTASAKSLTYIATAVNEALAAEGLTSGRVQLNVTVNAPSTSVNVYAGYKVTSDADRLTLTVE